MNEALDAALEKKDLKALKLALEQKPDLTSLDSSGLAPLHRATENKKLDLAEALLEAGASLDVKDDDKNTPLYRLLKSKKGTMSELELTNARWLVERGASLNVPGRSGMTALHFAARSAPVDFIQFLLDKGAKVTRHKSGGTPLQECVSTFFDDEKVWALLLANGCTPADVNSYGETLLHCAVSNHNHKAVKFFLENGVDPMARTIDGMTALDLAKKSNVTKAIALLGG